MMTGKPKTTSASAAAAAAAAAAASIPAQATDAVHRLQLPFGWQWRVRGGVPPTYCGILHLMDMLSMRQLHGFCCPSWASGSHQHQLEQKQRQRQQQQQQHQRRRPVWPIHAQSLWPQRQSQMHMGASAVLLLSATTHLMLIWGHFHFTIGHLCLGHGKGSSSNNTSTITITNTNWMKKSSSSVEGFQLDGPQIRL
ncbi:hypothetical protein ACLKA6_005703 [Drosophila palustris]